MHLLILLRLKKTRKKLFKAVKVKGEPISSYIENSKDVTSNKKYFWLLILVLLIVAAILVLPYSQSRFTSSKETNYNNSEYAEVIFDYLSRIMLPRREYYRNVYLKSEAWKRKRYLVLKRDKWRCLYCGSKATQVHHTKYAKRNIGKEPIEWLASICKTCHDSKHY